MSELLSTPQKGYKENYVRKISLVTKMSLYKETLLEILKKPKHLRPPPLRYTENDISKETLEKWAADNGKTRKQIHRRKYHIKKHMRIVAAKEAAAAEEAKAKAAEGARGGADGSGHGENPRPKGPRPAVGGDKRPAKKRPAQKEEQDPNGRDVVRKLSSDPEFPWNHPEYVNMMIEEYGGGCGVMNLIEEGVLPSALLQ